MPFHLDVFSIVLVLRTAYCNTRVVCEWLRCLRVPLDNGVLCVDVFLYLAYRPFLWSRQIVCFFLRAVIVAGCSDFALPGNHHRRRRPLAPVESCGRPNSYRGKHRGLTWLVAVEERILLIQQ